jgi:NADPH:quinone reductase-like Zn-dependent oxidoreductase
LTIYEEIAMARVVRCHQTGGPEVLKIKQAEVPLPGKGEVQIRVKALGLNRVQSMFRRGHYLEAPSRAGSPGASRSATRLAASPTSP